MPGQGNCRPRPDPRIVLRPRLWWVASCRSPRDPSPQEPLAILAGLKILEFQPERIFDFRWPSSGRTTAPALPPEAAGFGLAPQGSDQLSPRSRIRLGIRGLESDPTLTKTHPALRCGARRILGGCLRCRASPHPTAPRDSAICSPLKPAGSPWRSQLFGLRPKPELNAEAGFGHRDPARLHDAVGFVELHADARESFGDRAG